MSSTRHLTAAALCTIATGIAAAPSAHAQAARADVDLGPALPSVAVDTTTVQHNVARVRTAAIERVHFSLRRANSGLVAPTATRVQRILRQAGVTTYAIVDGSGRVLRGPGVVSVHTSRGLLAVGWANDLRGCLQVALSNTLAPQSFNVDVSMPLQTRVASGRALGSASLRNVTVAVVC